MKSKIFFICLMLAIGIGQVSAQKQTMNWKGQSYKAGDKVKITKRAGTFKPEDTGYSKEVDAGPGQVGKIIGGVNTDTDSEHSEKNTNFNVVEVQWKKQTWKEYNTGNEVELKSFKASIHLDYLEKVGK